jgi:2,4-didehydro-3-deoxy-L-rhamnonate hydrolase
LRIANVAGRAKLLVDGGQVDIESASKGRFSADPAALFERMGELQAFAGSTTQADEAWDPATAGPPSPAPRQIFAIALNYADHAAESGVDAPSDPLVFAKYVTSLSGPFTEVVLPAGLVDWEVELVAVIGATARNVRSSVGWEYVAGLTAGQDLSERQLQLSGLPAPQFGLAKSFPGFSPTGPALVSPEEFDRPDDLGLGCDINGEEVQKGRTSDMIFTIPELIAYLSRIVTLLPGDLIFTGTPPGVGMGRTPPRFLQEGDRLHSWIEGIGDLEQTFTQPAPAND